MLGKGFRDRDGTAVIGHAFAALGLRELIAFTHATNAASRRVMEKIGFVYERDFFDDAVLMSCTD